MKTIQDCKKFIKHIKEEYNTEIQKSEIIDENNIKIYFDNFNAIIFIDFENKSIEIKEGNVEGETLIYKHGFNNGYNYIGITDKENPNDRFLNGKGYSKNEGMSKQIEIEGWNNISHKYMFDGLRFKKQLALLLESLYIQLYNSMERGYNMVEYSNEIDKNARNKMSKCQQGENNNSATPIYVLYENGSYEYYTCQKYFREKTHYESPSSINANCTNNGKIGKDFNKVKILYGEKTKFKAVTCFYKEDFEQYTDDEIEEIVKEIVRKKREHKYKGHRNTVHLLIHDDNINKMKINLDEYEIEQIGENKFVKFPSQSKLSVALGIGKEKVCEKLQESNVINGNLILKDEDIRGKRLIKINGIVKEFKDNLEIDNMDTDELRKSINDDEIREFLKMKKTNRV